MSLEALTPYAVFGFVTLVGWWLLEMLANRSGHLVERLETIRRSPGKRSAEELQRPKSTPWAKLVETASTAGKVLEPRNEYEESKLRGRLAAAGFRSEAAPAAFLGIKVILGTVCFLGAGGALALSGGLDRQGLMYTVIAGGIGFYLPEIVLSLLVSRRKKAIFRQLPDVLDLLVVCVEAGLGLDQAMRKVVAEMRETCPQLCEELAIVNFQIQMGRPRSEVLYELGSRTDVDDLRTLAVTLVQAEKLGSSIAQALRTQSDALRTRRRQIAEEKAAKTAVKLIFPLVLFIFPGIFVVLVGPAAIQISEKWLSR